MNHDVSTLNFYEQQAARFIKGADSADLSSEYALFRNELKGDALKGTRILDAGCGSGRDAAAFWFRYGIDVTAIDASAAMVKATREKGVAAEVMRIQDISWKDHFDGVWACASLLHIPLDDISHVSSLLVRSLKTDGVLYASVG